MIPFEVILVFCGASVALALAPGPDNLYVLTQSALYGRGAGLSVTLGLCTGLLVHTGAVALGVAALVKASVVAFNVMKLIGAGYLLYLAWLAFRANPIEVNQGQDQPISCCRYFGRGILMNVSNPKVAIFFLAFLPQFTDPVRGSVTIQMLYLGGLFIGVTILVFGGVAILAGFLNSWLNGSRKVQVFLNRMAGVVFIGLAVKLVVSSK